MAKKSTPQDLINQVRKRKLNPMANKQFLLTHKVKKPVPPQDTVLIRRASRLLFMRLKPIIGQKMKLEEFTERMLKTYELFTDKEREALRARLQQELKQ